MKVNIKKCKLLRLNTRNKEPVMIKDQEIEDVEKFVYLGATGSNVGGGTENINNRVLKAKGVFRKLRKIWSSKTISKRTKLGYTRPLASQFSCMEVRRGK